MSPSGLERMEKDERLLTGSQSSVAHADDRYVVLYIAKLAARKYFSKTFHERVLLHFVEYLYLYSQYLNVFMFAYVLKKKIVFQH